MALPVVAAVLLKKLWKPVLFVVILASVGTIAYFRGHTNGRSKCELAIADEVIEEMTPYLGELYGNPSSMHSFGGQVGNPKTDWFLPLPSLFQASPPGELVLPDEKSQLVFPDHLYVIVLISHELYKKQNFEYYLRLYISRMVY